MYNDSAIHSVPAIINLMSNGLLNTVQAVTGASNDLIGVFSYPWPQTTKERGFDNAAFTSTLILAMAFVLIPGGFGIDVVRDRQVSNIIYFLRHVDRISIEVPTLYFKGSQIEISKL